jgi:4a-hydroxytetrahydrobiopterin dehydratase
MIRTRQRRCASRGWRVCDRPETVKTRAELLASHSQPLSGEPMSAAHVAAQLAQLDAWSTNGKAIERNFSFPDFRATMAFVNAVAELANEQDHHPELIVSYAACRVRFDTHSVRGVSINDFICAARTDAIYDSQQRELQKHGKR